MRRNLEKYLNEFNELSKKESCKSGILYADEVQELLFISLNESEKKWGNSNELVTLILTIWKIAFIAGYKYSKNQRKK